MQLKILHQTVLVHKLRYIWYFRNDLASGAKPGVLPPGLGSSMPFCIFSTEDLGSRI